MLNQVVIVGRLTRDPEIKELENKKEGYIILAIPRSYKNAEGIYETDFVKCSIYDNIASNVNDYCNKGDIVGVKGRLETVTEEKEDGEKIYKLKVIAEKVTFLSSAKKEDKEEEKEDE